MQQYTSAQTRPSDRARAFAQYEAKISNYRASFWKGFFLGGTLIPVLCGLGWFVGTHV